MNKFLSSKKLNILFSLLSIVTIIIIWIIAYFVVRNDYIIPSLSSTLKEVWAQITSVTFWKAFSNTLLRTLLAFVISFITAVFFASLGALYNPFKAFMHPIMTLLRTAPTMAVVIILLIWSNAKIAPVVITIFVLLPMMYSAVIAAIDGIDKGLVEMAKVYKLSVGCKLFKIYLPQIAPNVLSQAGAHLSFGLKLMVSAEVLSYTANSLGGLMQTANLYIRIPEFFALVIIAVIFGFLIEVVVNLLVTLVGRWQAKGGEYDN